MIKKCDHTDTREGKEEKGCIKRERGKRIIYVDHILFFVIT